MSGDRDLAGAEVAAAGPHQPSGRPRRRVSPEQLDHPNPWGMHPVKIAPSTRIALRRITAKDSGRSSVDLSKQLLESSMQELAAVSSKHLCEGAGRLWDSESEDDYEDLGDADLLANRVTQIPPETASASSPTLDVPPSITTVRGTASVAPLRNASRSHGEGRGRDRCLPDGSRQRPPLATISYRPWPRRRSNAGVIRKTRQFKIRIGATLVLDSG